MQKAELINLFGNVVKTAAALKMSTSGLAKWPEGELPVPLVDRALGASIRVKGMAVSIAHFPNDFEKKKS